MKCQQARSINNSEITSSNKCQLHRLEKHEAWLCQQRSSGNVAGRWKGDAQYL